MSNLTLTEALKLLRNRDLGMSMDVLEFANQVDSAGMEVLSTKDEEYVIGMLALLESLSQTILIGRGYDVKEVLDLTSSDTQSAFSALMMKLTLGIAVLEELH